MAITVDSILSVVDSSAASKVYPARVDSLVLAHACLIDDLVKERFDRLLDAVVSRDTGRIQIQRAKLLGLSRYTAQMTAYWKRLFVTITNNRPQALLEELAAGRRAFLWGADTNKVNFRDSLKFAARRFSAHRFLHLLAEVEYTWGGIYREHKKYDSALLHFERCSALADTAGTIALRSRYLNARSILLINLHRYGDGLKWGTVSYDLARRGELDEELAYNCYCWVWIFHYMGDYRMVVQRSQVAERLYLKLGDPRSSAEVAQLRAYALYRLGRSNESELLFSVKIGGCVAMGDPANVAWGNLYRADCRLDRNDTSGLREQILSAKKYAEDSADVPALAMVNLELAQLETIAGHYREAARAAGTSASLFEDAADSLYPLKCYGRALLRLGKADSAIVQLRSAERCLDVARRRYPRSSLRKRYLNDKLDLVGDLIRAELLLGNAGEALRTAEAWKAASLRESFSEQLDSTGDFSRGRQRINGELSQIIRRVRLCQFTSADSSREESEIVSLLDSLADIELQSATIADGTIAPDSKMTSPELNDGDSNAIALYYFANDKDSIMVVWYALGSEVRTVDISATHPDIWQDLDAARRLCRRPPSGSSSADSLTRALDRLIELIPVEVRRRLNDFTRIIVYPSGPLYYLPFEAIRLQGTYLGDSVALEYAHSVAIRRTLRFTKCRQDSARVAVFGGTFAKQGNQDCRIEFGNELDKYRHLPKLNGTVSEDEAVRNAFGAAVDSYIDGPHQEEQLKATQRGRYSIIHIACHSVMNTDFPELSGLVLPLDGVNGDDNILRGDELRHLHLDAGLVVLSACHTGEGEMIAGEGMVGLTQALMLAGVRSTLVSLWSVSDLATSHLMGRFYKEMAKGVSTTEALKVARKALISSGVFSHPYFWSGFVSFGDYKIY